MPADFAVAGVVLAAGASRRMGTNKMLLALDGEPLVRRAARRALAAGLSPVVVVLGHEERATRGALEGLPLDVAVNAAYAGPTSGSLHRGLERLGGRGDAVVVLLGDMVFVDETMIAALIAAARRGGVPLAVSRYGEVTAPPLLFRRALIGELLEWNGEGCGKAVVHRHRDEAAFVDWPERLLADVDTPEDFRAATLDLARQPLEREPEV